MTKTQDTVTRTRNGIELTFNGDKVARTDKLATAVRTAKTEEAEGGWTITWNNGAVEGPFKSRPEAVQAMTRDGVAAAATAKAEREAAKVAKAAEREAAKKTREAERAAKAKEREAAKKEREKAAAAKAKEREAAKKLREKEKAAAAKEREKAKAAKAKAAAAAAKKA